MFNSYVKLPEGIPQHPMVDHHIPASSVFSCCFSIFTPTQTPIFFQILPLKSQHFGPQIRRPSPWRPTSVPRSRAHPDLALDGQMAWDRPADYQRGSTRSSVVRPANFPSSAAWVLSVSVVVGERNSSESDKMPRPGKIFGTWNSAMGP